MGVNVYQEHGIIGSKVQFRRDPQADNPVIDLGVITSIQPNVTSERVELADTYGGTRRVVATGASQITEAYQITCGNVNMRNFAFALLGAKPSSFTQGATERTAAIKAFKGSLSYVVDNDAAATRLFNLTSILGLHKGATATKNVYGTGVAVDAAAKKIILAGDQTAVAALAPGKAFFLNSAGLVTKANAKSYTIVSRTLVSGQTELVVAESPVANETTLVGATITHAGAGGSDVVFLPGVDWEVVDLARGDIRILSGGAVTDLETLNLTFLPAALTGERLVYPQTSGTIEGRCWIFLASDGRGTEKVREARVSITPENPTFGESEFATLSFSLTVLSDSSDAVAPAGRFLHMVGAVPSAS